MNAKRVDIIIVTHNNWQYTRALLNSLRQYTDTPYRVICIDNASSDQTGEEVKRYGEVQFFPQETNLGYAKAVNKGVEQVASENFILLNNDTVVSPHWLSDWLRIFKANPQYWQLSTNSNCIIDVKDEFRGVSHDKWQEYKKLNTTKSPEQLISGFYPKYAEFCQELKNKWQDTIETIEAPKGFLGGWALLMKAGVIPKIGGYLYDERFPYGFYEDVDLSWRIGLAGGKVGIARGVYIHHFINTTFDSVGLKKQLLARHNKWRFIDKWEEYLIKEYRDQSEGDIDKLKELLETDPGQQSIVEYLGMKRILDIESYDKTESN